ncbi:Protein csk22 [Paenibacillus allorhizoplanae]|uniref:Protein csk22 n=1 Tax=Paenibacillus allorhizoplanae TaxID=2905648 RepID=A0ABN8GJE9_9BACL|nr:CcdC protein domain-containing protein [Paenibacillus allorhizoplanae]CAH1210541.1 Protein csk22 [Paenibacillus allorhizoplanae]
MQDALHYVIPILIFGFFIYRRVKRTIGFQKLTRGRLIFRLSLFSLFGVVIFLLGFVHPIHFIGYLIGLAGGALLGRTAIRHTRFEHRSDGWYYRTHLWIEITVLVLFLGRIAYRYASVAISTEPTTTFSPAELSQFTKDPVTAGVFFIIVSYYVLFFSYLLREGTKLDPAGLADGDDGVIGSHGTPDTGISSPQVNVRVE